MGSRLAGICSASLTIAWTSWVSRFRLARSRWRLAFRRCATNSQYRGLAHSRACCAADATVRRIPHVLRANLDESGRFAICDVPSDVAVRGHVADREASALVEIGAQYMGNTPNGCVRGTTRARVREAPVL